MSNQSDSKGHPLPRKENTEPQESPWKQVALDVAPPIQETENPFTEVACCVSPELIDNGENGPVMSNQSDSKSGDSEGPPLPTPQKEKTDEPQESPLTQVALDVATGNTDNTDTEGTSSIIPESDENLSDMPQKHTFYSMVITILKVASIFGFLYVFICSLDLMQTAFQLFGGKAAGYAFSNHAALSNPLAGLAVGILSTVAVQSTSTSTSIVVSMVASNIIDVKTAIPIIMGANIGTSVINTIVSLAQSHNSQQFGRAFSAAIVHDMYNWLSVLVILPLEFLTGYLLAVTGAIVNAYDWQASDAEKELMNSIIRPFTRVIIQLDKEVVHGVSSGNISFQNLSMIKQWCLEDKSEFDEMQIINKTSNQHRCTAMLNRLQLSDPWSGVILLILSLTIMAICLASIVKILNCMRQGQVAVIIKKTLNFDFTGRFPCLAGYLALLIGCGLTISVQGSSVFLSTLMPLVGIGMIPIDRMYPLTLGSIVGTTIMGILVALTATGIELRISVQLALCQLFFNLTGILFFYVVPSMRLPITLARWMGECAERYKWFVILYMILAYVVSPISIFALAMAGIATYLCILIFIALALIALSAISYLQNKIPVMLSEMMTIRMRPLETVTIEL